MIIIQNVGREGYTEVIKCAGLYAFKYPGANKCHSRSDNYRPMQTPRINLHNYAKYSLTNSLKNIQNSHIKHNAKLILRL